jgi:hypothetical protein
MVNDARLNNPFFRLNPETEELIIHDEPKKENKVAPAKEEDSSLQRESTDRET